MIRSAISALLMRGVRRLTRDMRPRTIYSQDGVSRYLSRYYLIGAPRMLDGSSPFDRFGNPKPMAQWPNKNFGLYVHQFHRGDQDVELHNHPWAWSLSFVIAGGYSEERRVGERDVVRREVKPLSFNPILGDTFHRVDLLEREAWTLFLVGPKVSSWGFWDRKTGDFTEWRAFLSRKQPADGKPS